MRKVSFIIIVVLLFSVNVVAQFAGGSRTSVEITNATEYGIGSRIEKLRVEIDEASFVKGSGDTGNEVTGVTIPDPQEKFHDVALTLTANSRSLMSTGYTFDGFKAVNNSKKTGALQK